MEWERQEGNQQNIFARQSTTQGVESLCLLLYKLVRASQPFSEGEFLKECMVETASLLCQENKSKCKTYIHHAEQLLPAYNSLAETRPMG